MVEKNQIKTLFSFDFFLTREEIDLLLCTRQDGMNPTQTSCPKKDIQPFLTSGISQ